MKFKYFLLLIILFIGALPDTAVCTNAPPPQRFEVYTGIQSFAVQEFVLPVDIHAPVVCVTTCESVILKNYETALFRQSTANDYVYRYGYGSEQKSNLSILRQNDFALLYILSQNKLRIRSPDLI